MASGVAPGAGGPCGRMPRGRRRRGLMTFLPARTRGAPGWACAQRGSMTPRCCAVEPVSASGTMAVFLSRCIARADQKRARLLAADGRRTTRLGVTAARLPRCGSRGAESLRRPGPLRPAPGAMGLGLPFLEPEAPSEEPTRSHAVAPITKVEARFAWRAGRGGADSKRGDCWSAAPPRGR